MQKRLQILAILGGTNGACSVVLLRTACPLSWRNQLDPKGLASADGGSILRMNIS
jgi:hypothetical protein